jgi:3-dehydroquinate synthase
MTTASWCVPSVHGPYTVSVGAGIATGSAGSLLAPGKPGCRTLLLTHPTLMPLMGEGIAEQLRQFGEVGVKTVPEGEGSKSIGVAEGIWGRLATERYTRGDRIVCLGGGVIGDLGGFVAATWMRGIDYLSLPTTLLAQVDSSIGGKVAVNLPAGKNLVGCFYPPRAVVSDVSFLATLPEREFRSGLAEVVKYGVVLDAELFSYLETHREKIVARDCEVLREVVTRCARIKSGIVAQDEREGGVRALLNFGHTLGHAIEAESGYGNVSHGEAVSIGMIFAARMSEMYAGFSSGESARLLKLLREFHLPHEWETWDVEALMERMKGDKKTSFGGATLVLTPSLGAGTVTKGMAWELLRDVLH